MTEPSRFQEPDTQAVRELLSAMAGRHVLVVGDGMLDSYVYGNSSRLSPEAPVQVVQVEREEHLLGGAANVAKCLVALGAKVTLCCLVGRDSSGEQFIKEAVGLNIETRLIFREPSRPTTVKMRIVSGRQHIVRVDRDGRTPYPAELMEKVASAVHHCAQQADAVFLSDYDKGVLTDKVCKAAISGAQQNARPVVVDPKGNRWSKYEGATVLKPNWREALAFLATRDSMVMTLSPHLDDRDAEAIASQLRNGAGVQHVLLTRAEHGMSLAMSNGECLSFAARTRDVKDEAGAGDVVGAVTCLALSAQAPLPLAAWLGNVAAGAKVAKFGTHTVSDFEILEALGEKLPVYERKLFTAIQAAEFAAKVRSTGKKVVFTNGCFDFLHFGHVSYLERSRQLGDALIVGINTDASVRRLNKGPDRPQNVEGNRARIIAAQSFVDGVVLFDEDTPLELIKAIKPDILCKGADYKSKEDVVGWDVVEAHGGRVILVDLVAGHSTSNMINKIRQGLPASEAACSSCGKPRTAKAAFCAYCGTKFLNT